MHRRHALPLATTLALAAACGSDSSAPSAPNPAPTVTVGALTAPLEGQRRTLTTTVQGGTAPFTYTWSQVSGATVVFDDAAAASPTAALPSVDASETEAVVLRVECEDAVGRTASDELAFAVGAVDRVVLLTRDSNNGVFALDVFDPATGTSVRLNDQLPGESSVVAWAWTARRDQVVFTADIDAPVQDIGLFAMALGDLTVRRVSEPSVDPREVRAFVCSPLEDVVAYAQLDDGAALDTETVLAVSLADTSRVTLAPATTPLPANFLRQLGWRGDGSAVLFEHSDEATGDVFLHHALADGSATTVVSPALVSTAVVLDWELAPDGASVAARGEFAAAGVSDLFVTTLPAGTPVQVSPTSGPSETVASFLWAPDSDRLALRHGVTSPNTARIFVVAPDGSGPRRCHWRDPLGRRRHGQLPLDERRRHGPAPGRRGDARGPRALCRERGRHRTGQAEPSDAGLVPRPR